SVHHSLPSGNPPAPALDFMESPLRPILPRSQDGLRRGRTPRGNQMFESDRSSNQPDVPQLVEGPHRSTPRRRLVLPGVGLVMALLIAACFWTALRPGK